MSRSFSVLSRVPLVLPFLLAAQTPDTATVHGRITDQSHAAVADVRVTVKNTLTNVERSAQTDASGDFTIGGLPIAGRYDIRAEKSGFAVAQLTGMALTGGTTANVNLELNVAQEKAQVTVTGVVG